MTLDWRPFGDLMNLQRRAVDSAPTTLVTEIGIRSFGRGVFHKEPVRIDALGRKRVFRVHEGDLVISNVFAWEGAIAVASAKDANLVGSHRFMTWTPKSANIVPAYVREYLLSTRGLADIARQSPGSAGRNRTLGISKLEEILIPVPSEAAQSAIADRLDRISLVDRPSNIVSSTSTIRDRLLESQSDNARRVELSKVLKRSTTTVPVDTEAEYSMLGLHNRWRGPFHSGTIRGSDTKYKYLRQVSTGDLVYIKLSAWDGAFGFIPPEFDGYFVSPEFISYSVDATVDRHYLRAALRSPDFVSAVRGESRGTNVNRRRLQPDVFESIRIPLPPSNQQRDLGVHLARIDLLASLDTRRASLAKSLLPAARNEEFRDLLYT